MESNVCGLSLSPQLSFLPQNANTDLKLTGYIITKGLYAVHSQNNVVIWIQK